MNKLASVLAFLFTSTFLLAQNTFPSSGNVGIGTTSPGFPLHVVAPPNNWKGWFSGSDGYISIGPANAGWAHIYTDRPHFIFNQNVWSIPGGFSSYSSSDLTLQTSGTTRLTVANSTGYVGIGTPAPAEKLDVRGNLILEANNSPVLYTGTGSVELNRYLLIANSPSYGSASGLKAGGIVVSDSYAYANPGKNDLIVKGNVGIGTTNPDSKLSVKGTIHTQEVKVDLNGSVAPDYVFEKDYPLTSLEELKSYIDQYKHLPEVPSAAAMEEDGINLKEMNLLLLKKVEELTLHVIEHSERASRSEEKVEELTLKLLEAKLERDNEIKYLKEDIEMLRAKIK